MKTVALTTTVLFLLYKQFDSKTSIERILGMIWQKRSIKIFENGYSYFINKHQT